MSTSRHKRTLASIRRTSTRQPRHALWRSVAPPEDPRTNVKTDPQAPWMCRVNGPLSNMPEFDAAWGCKPGDPMVQPADKRAAIW